MQKRNGARKNSIIPQKRIGFRTVIILTAMLSFVLTGLSLTVLIIVGNYFEKQIPNNDNWAAATIAIPLALFSMLIPIYSYHCKRNSGILVGKYTVGMMRKRSITISSIINVSFMQCTLYLLIWIWYFINQGNSERAAKLIYCALYSSFHCIVLITIFIISNKESAISIFKKRFLQDYNDTDRYIDTKTDINSKFLELKKDRISIIQTMEELAAAGTYLYFSSMVASIYSGNAGDVPKGAFLSTYEAISKTKFKLSSALMSSYLISVGKELFFFSHKRKDYGFSINLIRSMIFLYNSKSEQYNRLVKRAISIPDLSDFVSRTPDEKKIALQSINANEIKEILFYIAILARCENSIIKCCKFLEDDISDDVPKYIMNCYDTAINGIKIDECDKEISSLFEIAETIGNKAE